MKSLIYRNILLFFKDRTAVFFSFLAVFVVFFLYLCFLKEAMMKPLLEQFPNTAEELCNTWIIAGTLGILSLTSSLSVLGVFIADRTSRVIEDFQVSPLSTTKITLSYMISTVLITLLIALFTLGVGELYIYYQGGRLLNGIELGMIILVLLLSISACTSILFVFLLFFKSNSSFSNVTTIIGTLSGFLMGIYVPIASLPDFLQNTVRYFPFSQSASLLRQVMMERVMEDSFHSIVDARILFEEQFGLVFHYNQYVMPFLGSVLILLGVSLIGILLSTLFMRIIFRT